MKKPQDSTHQLESLLSSLLQITETMMAKKNVNEIKTLYQDGLHTFLQLKTLNHSFFGFDEEMALHVQHPINKQEKYVQPEQMQVKLNEKIAEKHFYFSQLTKLKRENKETDDYLSSVAEASDFDLQCIDTELTHRIRLEKELLELKKNLKAITAVKETEEKKLDEFKAKLKTFAEFSKPINDYLLLGNTLKSLNQNTIDTSEPERTAYLSRQLPTPLYVLYKTLQQNILTYKKQQKLSVDIIESPSDLYFKDLDISPLSVILRIITRRRKEFGQVILTLKFDYLNALDVVLLTPYSQKGEITEFNEQEQKEEPELLNDLMKNDNGERLPTSSKAFSFPTLVSLTLEFKGRAYDWVQSLCGYTIVPSPSLSFAERVNYQPLGQIIDYIPVKYRPAEVSSKQDNKIDVDDAQVEVVEMDDVDQGDLMMMQDQDFVEKQDKEDEDAKPESDGDDSDAKNDPIPEEENEMVMDDTKISDIMSKRRTDLTGDSSISMLFFSSIASLLFCVFLIIVALNLVRMVKDHWWKKNS